ncbi:MAG: aminopeptidase [Candidatus Zixiibacteriota bacterium]|nr:MAG: aminopeptidase [candidate division Zixibacteria bacterium]
MDPRVEKLAKVLLHYSLKLKKGQILKIQGETVALPLIKAAYAEAVKIGAHPFVSMLIPDNEEAFLKHASEEQLKFISPLARAEVNKIHALLHIWASENLRYLSSVDPKRQARFYRIRRVLKDRFYRRVEKKEVSWVGTQFPTLADAQDADMSLADYENFVFRAGHVHAGNAIAHWKKVHREQQRLVRILNRCDRLHLQARDTDLKLRVKGRRWINCAGTENFPDGEIFTCPVENSAAGFIRYTYPAVFGGREVEDVRMEFKEGKVVNETAGKNERFLTEMLNSDRGARYLGEFAIGTNYEIKRFSKNTLFDEKIGGTCHLAVGNGMEEAGGKNKSAIHWDMVCDLKKDSLITADGKVIYRNGKFSI